MKVRNLLTWLLVVAMLFGLTACGGASTSAENMGIAEDSYYRAEVEAPQESKEEAYLATEAADGGNGQSLPKNRKLIRTIRMDAETEDMGPLISALEERIGQLGGYIENREVYNGSTYAQRRYRRADLTIRIPADKVDGFVDHVGDLSNIVSSNESVEDITLQYVDTESRVKALEVEQERLMSMLEKAETLEELLQIEDRLTDVRYELENYASRLRGYDNLVDYATVRLSISEVQEYTPVKEETFWQRISGGFVSSLKNVGKGFVEFVVWLLSNLPYLVVWGAIGAVIVLIIRRARKPKVKKNPFAKKQNPPEEKTE